MKEEGYIHHLLRHLLACFFTKGYLYQSWEKGRDIFDKYLLDADWCINNSNWMWISDSFSISDKYLQIYSPVTFLKQYDPTGKFVRKYIPELKNMPNKYIFTPWKAPLNLQQEVGCLIGRKYPLPIIDHLKYQKEAEKKHKVVHLVNNNNNNKIRLHCFNHNRRGSFKKTFSCTVITEGKKILFKFF